MKATRWFKTLPDEVLTAFASRAYVLSLERGALLTRKGEQPPGVGILISGAICASTVSLEGHEFTLSMTEFDGIIGLAAALDGKPSLRDSRVLSAAEVLIIPRSDFLAVLDQHPSFYKCFSHALCDRIRTANRIIDELALLSLRQRLARLLDMLVNTAADNDAASPGLIVQTQDELAHLLGVSRHAVNRELKRLEQAGMLQVGYGNIQITDSKLLSELIVQD
ncbi:Crp/Fnr family transcriptional regulator [Alcaligenaceae bacterium]|nr:Crp/Fnr family transcriptional regulator [Alcaligenaceae bacterium]